MSGLPTVVSLIVCMVMFLVEAVKGLQGVTSCLRPTRVARSGVRMATTAAIRGGSDTEHLFSVAPMMEYTDTHQRIFQRIMSKKAVLYTEMVTTNALTRSGDVERFLAADLAIEEPLVLQLGGSDPVQMKESARLAHKYGYREINLNIGCPSEKVSGAGCFGAVLYHTPDLVAQLALAVGEAIGKSATVKCRIGTDGHESYEELCSFIRTVSEVGKVTHFIIHARIAVLGKKFTPKDNRTIPPLKYDVVYDLIRDFPHLHFSLNGGVGSIEEVQHLLTAQPRLHGVMVGRAVVNNPYAWSTVDSVLYKTKDPGLSRMEVLEEYAKYAARPTHDPRATRAIIKPALNLFAGVPNGKLFRQRVDGYIAAKRPAAEALLRAAECFDRANYRNSGEDGDVNRSEQQQLGMVSTDLPSASGCSVGGAGSNCDNDRAAAVATVRA